MLPIDTALAGAITVDSTSCDSSGSSSLTIGRLSTPGNTGQADGNGNFTYPLAAGCDAKASNSGTAFGTFATATGRGSAAFGFNAQATGRWATALGLETVANALGSTALGFGSNATGTNAVSIGGAAVSESSALSVANSTTASGAGAIAIGSNTTRGARATGASAVALAGESTASGARAIAVGEGAQATANDTIAMGSRSVASGIDSIAIGRNNNVTAGASQALGSNNSITSTGDAVTIGDSNSVTGSADNAVLLGDSNRVTSVNGIALGSVNMVSGRNGVAVGHIAIASGENSLALGSSATATSTGAIALGNEASASGEQAIAIGDGSVASGDESLSVGHGNTVSGAGSGAFGDPNTVSGAGSYAVGNDNTIEADNAGAFGSNNSLGDDADNSYVVGFGSSASAPRSLAFGDSAKAGNADSVALGSNATTAAPVSTDSTSIAGQSYDVAGTSPVGTVSVGSEAVIAEDGSVEQTASQRTLTNVAAGRVSANSTDAVNGSQLFAATEAIETLDESAVQYDRNAEGELDTSSVTLEGADGTTITNLADGEVAADSSDAINGSQLHATNQNVTTNTENITTNTTDIATNTTDIGSLEEGLASTTAAGVKYDRNAEGELDTSSVTLEGADGTTITNLADGEVAADSSDAINGSQLHTTNQNVTTNADNITSNTTNISTNTTNIATNTTDIGSLEEGLASTTAAGVTYDRNAEGELDTSSVTLEGTDGTTITNLADGEVAADSSDAINGSQLHATNQNVSTNADNITSNTTNISTNTTNIATNTTDIGSLEEGLASSTAAGVKYDRNAEGELDTSSVTLEGTDGTTITNLADGEVAADSSDAINGSQLHTTNQNVTTNADNITSNTTNISTNTTNIATNTTDIDSLEEGLASTSAAGVKYDRNADGTLNTANVTLRGDSGTKISNLADATESQDAVSLRQLRGAVGSLSDTGTLFFHANSAGGRDHDSLALGEESIAVGPLTTVNANHGTGIGYDALVETSAVRGVAVGDRSRVSGASSIALGADASAGTDNSVALGAGAVTGSVERVEGIELYGVRYGFSGTPVGTVSIGAAGAERTLTNVAPGRVSAESTDAVNGSQLHATNQAVVGVGERVDGVEASVGKIGDKVDTLDRRVEGIRGQVQGMADSAVQYDADSNRGQVTLMGELGTKVTNLADGEISQGSTEAVNGSQLWEVQQQLSQGQGSPEDFQSNSQGTTATSATGVNAVAAGGGAQATADGGVALGAGAVADRPGMNGEREAFSEVVVNSSQGALSVGSRGSERQITHVAGGSEDTDAVNVRQLRSVQQGAVNYDRQADGSVDYRSVSLGNGGSEPVQVHNVAAGRAPNDAVNVSQLSALDSKYSTAYGNLSDRIDQVERDASAGIAAVAAMGDAPYVAGKLTYHVGTGYHNGESALGVSMRRTADNGRWSLGMGVGASSADATVSFGVSGIID